jgi:hypothetical protein
MRNFLYFIYFKTLYIKIFYLIEEFMNIYYLMFISNQTQYDDHLKY